MVSFTNVNIMKIVLLTILKIGLRPVFKKFSGLSGSRINEAMEARETIYMAYILKKTA